ncbi:MAG: 6,7-dimethyl-8-ribityllumazine synthase [Lysobacterales bacterium]|jgi:6,7-dimethyl-8-ribityllumazine synthase
MKVIEGKIRAKGKRIAVVVARFNEFITKRLLDGCLDELSKAGVAKTNITVIWVPGAFEIPVAALKAVRKNHAVVCLGCIIKGETDHYDLVAEGTTKGIMDVITKTGKPVVFEVLATETVELSEKRVDKGRDAAQVALEMIDVLSQIGKVKNV